MLGLNLLEKKMIIYIHYSVIYTIVGGDRKYHAECLVFLAEPYEQRFQDHVLNDVNVE